MRYLLAAALTFLMPFTAIASSLPLALEKNTHVAGFQTCDQGRTKLIKHENPVKELIVIEVGTASGDTFYIMDEKGAERFFLKKAGSKKFQELTHQRLKDELQKAAPKFHDYFYLESNDCL